MEKSDNYLVPKIELSSVNLNNFSSNFMIHSEMDDAINLYYNDDISK
jgi:hypothetical protein